MTDRQQHFLKTFGPHETLFNQLGLQGREIIEIGVGHGELTRLVLAAGAERVVGFEIDPELSSPVWDDPRVELYVLDFRLHAQAKVAFNTKPALIANPPYDLLDDVFALIRDQGIQDVVLMIPATRPTPPGFKFAFALDGDAFDPPSRGVHHVVYRWWGSKTGAFA